jgi:hypothetical protein
VFDLARQLAASGPVGSHHLLEALARSPETAAGQALAAIGVVPEALATAIDALDLDATSDVTPVEAAARKMHLTVADDGQTATITMADPPTVALIQTLADQLGGGPVRGDDPTVGSMSGLWQAIERELQSLLERLQPLSPEPADEGGVLSPVRQAIQNRLRRRRAG